MSSVLKTKEPKERAATHSLTNGPVSLTFEEIIGSLQNFGFSQSVFEVERGGKTDPEVLVLRPSSIQAHHPDIQPGDWVRCPGLGPDAQGEEVVCRVRRMAEGFGRNRMTVWPS